jgi:hypothetical protein
MTGETAGLIEKGREKKEYPENIQGIREEISSRLQPRNEKGGRAT